LDNFAESLQEWQIFFSTVSLASVTLAGLLFVSLSLRLESIRGPRKLRILRLARGSFGDFLYVLMLGLVFLVPHQVPFGLAVALLVLGAARGVGLLREALRERKAAAVKGKVGPVLRELGLPALASLGLLVVSIEVLRGETLAVFALVLVVAALLATASWTAWLILVEEGEEAG
jgi:hypothetical protein